MTLGERIKNYRHKEGLSQDKLAEKLNVSRQAITKWENDNGVPDIDNLIAISRLMGISLDELVIGEKEGNVPVIKKKGINQRNKSNKCYLIAAISFSVASVCWIISFIINCANGNDVAAIVNALNIVILIVLVRINLSRYFEVKENSLD